ncbi:MAG: DNA repair protein RecO [Pacificimonas sp.]
MHLDTPALLCTARAHGEHGVVVRLLTETSGLVAAYVNGGRSRASRPLMTPGNLVSARIDARSEGQLGQARLEMDISRAGLTLDPLRLAMAEWLSNLVADILPEGEAFPTIYQAMVAMFALLDSEASATQLGRNLARTELLLLGELGFRLDLGSCAATGDLDDLIYVSPKSGRAVSAHAGAAYREKLFALPAFLKDGGADADSDDIVAALRLTRHFILRDLLPDYRAQKSIAARDRVDARLGKRF